MEQQAENLNVRSLAIAAINPDSCDVNGPDLRLTVTGQQGAGFRQADTKLCLVSGGKDIALETEVTNGDALFATLEAPMLRQDAVLKVKACIVDNDDKIVKEGNEVEFPVGTPNPVIATIIPRRIVADDDEDPVKVIVSGRNFVAKSQILLNNTRLTAHKFINSCHIEFDVPKKYLKQGNKIRVMVVNTGTFAKESNGKVISVIGPDEWEETAAAAEAEEQAKKERAKEEKKKNWGIVGIVVFFCILTALFTLYGPCRKGETKEKESLSQIVEDTVPPAKESKKPKVLNPIKGIIDIEDPESDNYLVPGEKGVLMLDTLFTTVLGDWTGLEIEPGCKVIRKWQNDTATAPIFDTILNGSNKTLPGAENNLIGIGDGNGDGRTEFLIQRKN